MKNWKIEKKKKKKRASNGLAIKLFDGAKDIQVSALKRERDTWMLLYFLNNNSLRLKQRQQQQKNNSNIENIRPSLPKWLTSHKLEEQQKLQKDPNLSRLEVNEDTKNYHKNK